MTCSQMVIRPETPDDIDNINKLHAEAFGPGRFAKTAYRIREGLMPVADLSLVAIDCGRLVGSIQFTAVRVGGRSGALLLGPLAIFKEYAGKRCGLRLMLQGLEIAEQAGWELVLLVGDPPYYQRAGFEPVPVGQILLPGPVDYRRLLAVELADGALTRFRGLISQ